ncbi:MAG: exopolysaccharide biosynthesis polyprenyl glycosylphosphotransferase [Herbinix sp.]|jgi:exopolysaccharide biosynthesis polyprenyl glycosylphosphotransferase|nr:exopolysaccharide biosynthesis polyprenyl glycosylphosphotransferase [Herbinix sp.]
MDLMKRNLPNQYLLLVDLISILISFFITTWIRYGGITKDWLNLSIYGGAFILVTLLYIVIYYLYDTYSRLFKRGFLDEIITVFKINIILAATLTGVMYFFQGGTYYSRIFFLCFFLLNILITYIFRQYFKLLLLGVYKKSNSSYKIMIITTSDQVKNVLTRIHNENEWEYQITYLTILDQDLVGRKIEGIDVRSDAENMFEVAKTEVLDGIFIHIPYDMLDLNLEDTVLKFQNMGITVDLSINTFGLKIHEKVVREMSGYHVLTFSSQFFTESQMLLKRMIDIIGGLIGCIITLCLTMIIAPAIWLESPGPIFFTQIRIGKNGRRFKIYKFRSMYMDAEQRKAELMEHNEMDGFMFKMKNDPRVTKVGKFLRKTSLDEFPQFFNVIKGDMSLVGTRPPTESEFIQYESRHKRRLALKGGVTGLWQVSGRNDINNFEDVVKMDLEYIDNWSLKMDFKILFKTIGVVLFWKGSR